MRIVSVADKKFRIAIPQSEIKRRVAILADDINRDYAGQELVVVAVLNGSFMFVADLVRKIKVPCRVTFVKTSSYEKDASSGDVRQLIGLTEDLAGQHVLIIEDIIETGNTMRFILNYLKKFSPADIRLASLIVKLQSFDSMYHVDYVGFEKEDRFVVGYGLDYDGFGRNLEDIYEAI